MPAAPPTANLPAGGYRLRILRSPGLPSVFQKRTYVPSMVISPYLYPVYRLTVAETLRKTLPGSGPGCLASRPYTLTKLPQDGAGVRCGPDPQAPPGGGRMWAGSMSRRDGSWTLTRNCRVPFDSTENDCSHGIHRHSLSGDFLDCACNQMERCSGWMVSSITARVSAVIRSRSTSSRSLALKAARIFSALYLRR
jgi:hypothetical protein